MTRCTARVFDKETGSHKLIEGEFQRWGESYQEFGAGPGNMTLAIIVMDSGEVVTAVPDDVTFLKKTPACENAGPRSVDTFLEWLDDSLKAMWTEFDTLALKRKWYQSYHVTDAVFSKIQALSLVRKCAKIILKRGAEGRSSSTAQERINKCLEYLDTALKDCIKSQEIPGIDSDRLFVETLTVKCIKENIERILTESPNDNEPRTGTSKESMERKE
jgi:hypothetical protein